MEKEYAYIDRKADEQGSSEAYVQRWLDRVLDNSTLDLNAKHLIKTQSKLPVEFRIFDGTEEG